MLAPLGLDAAQRDDAGLERDSAVVRPVELRVHSRKTEPLVDRGEVGGVRELRSEGLERLETRAELGWLWLRRRRRRGRGLDGVQPVGQKRDARGELVHSLDESRILCSRGLHRSERRPQLADDLPDSRAGLGELPLGGLEAVLLRGEALVECGYSCLDSAQLLRHGGYRCLVVGDPGGQALVELGRSLFEPVQPRFELGRLRGVVGDPGGQALVERGHSCVERVQALEDGGYRFLVVRDPGGQALAELGRSLFEPVQPRFELGRLRGVVGDPGGQAFVELGRSLFELV